MAREHTAVARQYELGTILFKEKDPGDKMYIIRSGRVKIYLDSGDNELVLAFLGPGDFFGEMALLEQLPRSASAKVVEPSEIIEVDIETFQEMIRRNIEIAVRIMKKLASRVRELDVRLEKLMVEDAMSRAVNVLRWLLPQGHLDRGWVRVPGISAHFDLASQAGIPAGKAKSVLSMLERAGCMKRDGDDLLIGDTSVLDNLTAYLELHREFSPMLKAGDPKQSEQSRAMRRLLGALSLSSDEVERQQQTLVSKYDRYLALKERYKAVDDG